MRCTVFRWIHMMTRRVLSWRPFVTVYGVDVEEKHRIARSCVLVILYCCSRCVCPRVRFPCGWGSGSVVVVLVAAGRRHPNGVPRGEQRGMSRTACTTPVPSALGVVPLEGGICGHAERRLVHAPAASCASHNSGRGRHCTPAQNPPRCTRKLGAEVPDPGARIGTPTLHEVA